MKGLGWYLAAWSSLAAYAHEWTIATSMATAASALVWYGSYRVRIAYREPALYNMFWKLHPLNSVFTPQEQSLLPAGMLCAAPERLGDEAFNELARYLALCHKKIVIKNDHNGASHSKSGVMVTGISPYSFYKHIAEHYRQLPDACSYGIESWDKVLKELLQSPNPSRDIRFSFVTSHKILFIQEFMSSVSRFAI